MYLNPAHQAGPAWAIGEPEPPPALLPVGNLDDAQSGKDEKGGVDAVLFLFAHRLAWPSAAELHLLSALGMSVPALRPAIWARPCGRAPRVGNRAFPRHHRPAPRRAIPRRSRCRETMSGKLCRLTTLASPFTLQSEAMAAIRLVTAAGNRHGQQPAGGRARAA